MKRRNYIFTSKKHSEKAIMSTILGIISNVSLGIVIYLTYQREGNPRTGYGMTGLLASLFSLIGLGLAVRAVVEKDSYRLFPGLGILLNGIALGIIGLILYLGRM